MLYLSPSALWVISATRTKSHTIRHTRTNRTAFFLPPPTAQRQSQIIHEPLPAEKLLKLFRTYYPLMPQKCREPAASFTKVDLIKLLAGFYYLLHAHVLQQATSMSLVLLSPKQHVHPDVALSVNISTKNIFGITIQLAIGFLQGSFHGNYQERNIGQSQRLQRRFNA